MSVLGRGARALADLAAGRSGDTGVVLAYHDVTTGRAEGLTVTAAALRRHIRVLRRVGMRIAPLRELVDRLGDGRSCAGLAALTFDDGLVGVHRHAVPVLQQEQAPATVFAVSAVWGEPPPWWPGSARTMTRAELAEVVAAGVEVAAHTRTHPSLLTVSDDALRHELHGCRSDLEDLFGTPVTALAYPNGHHDSRVRAAARSAGYQVAFTFLNGRLTGQENLLTLPRLTMTAGHTRARLAYHLARPAGSWPDHQCDSVGPYGPDGIDR